MFLSYMKYHPNENPYLKNNAADRCGLIQKDRFRQPAKFRRMNILIEHRIRPGVLGRVAVVPLGQRQQPRQLVGDIGALTSKIRHFLIITVRIITATAAAIRITITVEKI